jgi:aconitate hydratase
MDSFGARGRLRAGDVDYEVYRLGALADRGLDPGRLPLSLRLLLENLLRHEDGRSVTAEDIEALVRWDPAAEPQREIAFRPARVVLQDLTGVPAVVDLAAMREAMADLGGDPERINPLEPVELVIDHSVQVDVFGSSDAFARNVEREFERNRERYAFLRWGAAPGRAGSRARIRTRSWGRTRTPPWSTVSACWAGVWVASRPRRPCWGSRSRC